MLTTTCTLRQGDRVAHARLSTASPQQQGEVAYDGDVDLFTRRYPRLANADLRQVARIIAGETGAEAQVEDSGTFDWQAE